MSILEKLKDLVSSLEEDKEEKEMASSAPQKEPDEILSEEEQPEPEENVETVQELPDYLECTSEESSKVFQELEEVKALKVKLSELFISFEGKKLSLLTEIDEKTKSAFSELNSLRLKYDLPSKGYSVELPLSSEDKISFIKQ